MFYYNTSFFNISLLCSFLKLPFCFAHILEVAFDVKNFFPIFSYFSPSSKLVLSRSTSDALLASRISLPRIGNFQCDHCGHRNYGSTVLSSYDSYDSYVDNFNIGGLSDRRPMTRPHSVYTDQCNYVKFSFRVSECFPVLWFILSLCPTLASSTLSLSTTSLTQSYLIALNNYTSSAFCWTNSYLYLIFLVICGVYT